MIDLDLAGVSFLDCTGIGALVAVRNIAVHAGQQVRVSHPRPIVRRILELTGLLGVLTGPVGAPPPPESGHSTSTAPSAATLTQSSELIAAA